MLVFARCGFLTCLGLLILWSEGSAAQEIGVPLKYSVPSLTVTGTASTDVLPNLAIISLGVVTERPKAQEAATENAKIAQSLVAVIKGQGIEARDIRTVSVTLTPVYDEASDPEGRMNKRTLRGYSARNELSVRVRDIEKAGVLARQFLDNGANSFNGISFEYDQAEQKYDGLRADAARDALRKAKIYVNALGLRLGRILEIAPPSNRPMMPAPAVKAFAQPQADRAGVAVPVEPGFQTLTSEVQVVWELAQ
jgi:uncharacterized protein YggE